jgi:hypothetical protein
MKKALLALAAVVAVVAVGGGTALALSGGDDDKESRGTCGGNAYELAVEREDGGLEVTFELQSAAPGETWDVLVEQGGTTLLDGSRTTDEDGELDVDVPAHEKDGDTFTVTATPAAGATGAEPCTATVTR